jgi:hypothetical protein
MGPRLREDDVVVVTAIPIHFGHTDTLITSHVGALA